MPYKTGQEVVISAATQLSDEELCQLVQEHFSIDATPFFAQAVDTKTSHRNAPRQTGSHAAAKPVTLEQFVQKTAPLLELERAAEVDQVGEHTPDRSLSSDKHWGDILCCS